DQLPGSSHNVAFRACDGPTCLGTTQRSVTDDLMRAFAVAPIRTGTLTRRSAAPNTRWTSTRPLSSGDNERPYFCGPPLVELPGIETRCSNVADLWKRRIWRRENTRTDAKNPADTPTPRFTRDPPARWPRNRRHRWTAHAAVGDSCRTAPGAPASPPWEPRRLGSRSWTAGGPSCSGGRASCYRIPLRTTGW